MSQQQIDIFTAAMRMEFIKAYTATAETAPIESAYQIVPSTARIEDYAWMSPTPAIAQYRGHRRFGKISSIKYKVENIEFDSSFEVLLRDIEDDQIGGYKLKPQELSEKAKNFPNRWVLQTLALGNSTPCFDGSNFFATTHQLGTGNNLLTGSGTANSDGLTYPFYVLIKNKAIKPLLYQNRKAPRMMDNSKSPEAYLAKVFRYWIDLEGQAAYGYWWDAAKFTFTNLPTLTDLATAFGTISSTMRTFKLPQTNSADPGEYVHEQLRFQPSSVMLVSCTALEPLIRTILTSDNIASGTGGGVVSNVYKGWAEHAVSALVNGTGN